VLWENPQNYPGKKGIAMSAHQLLQKQEKQPDPQCPPYRKHAVNIHPFFSDNATISSSEAENFSLPTGAQQEFLRKRNSSQSLSLSSTL
jgi:hypothetical protein